MLPQHPLRHQQDYLPSIQHYCPLLVLLSLYPVLPAYHLTSFSFYYQRIMLISPNVTGLPAIPPSLLSMIIVTIVIIINIILFPPDRSPVFLAYYSITTRPGNDDHTNDRIDPILDLFLKVITISIRSDPIWCKLGFIFWCIPFL